MGLREIRTRLQENEPTWIWKIVLRSILTVVVLVSIGLAAFVTQQGYSPWGSDLSDDYFSNVWFQGAVFLFIPLGLSLIWSAIWFPVVLFRKAKLHPGFVVGIDLILWLVFVIIGALFSVSVGLSYQQLTVSSFDDSYIYGGGDYPGAQGQPNSTYSLYNNEPYLYESANGATVVRQPGSANYQCPYYNTCAGEDNILGTFRPAARAYFAASILILVCAVLHFVLWVWACVECARFNRERALREDYSRARLIAAEMVQGMQANNTYIPAQPTGPVAGPDVELAGGYAPVQAQKPGGSPMASGSARYA